MSLNYHVTAELYIGTIIRNNNSTTCDYTANRKTTLAPVAETGFSHRLTPYKSWGISLDGNIYREYLRIIRSEIVFFRIGDIPDTRSHVQLIFRTVIEKSWTFFGPWGRDRP